MTTYFTLPSRARRSWDPFHEIGTLQEELSNLLDATGFGRTFLSQRERRLPASISPSARRVPCPCREGSSAR